MKTIGIIYTFILMSISINAQEKRAFMLGLNPSVSVESYYDQGELDINIFPFTMQLSINQRIDLRFITLFNIGIRNDASGFSQMGLESALPIFLKAKEDLSDHSRGFYAAPVLSVSKSKLDQNTHIGLWAEPGYQFNIDKKFSLVLAAQAGTTYIHYIGGTGSWNSHLGLKVIIGWWM
jgi:hypothetical protein